jgi:hypothetical protein
MPTASSAPIAIPAIAPPSSEEESSTLGCPELAAAVEVEVEGLVVVVVELEVAVEIVVAVKASCSSSGGGALRVVLVGSPQRRSPFSSVPQHCHNPVA